MQQVVSLFLVSKRGRRLVAVVLEVRLLDTADYKICVVKIYKPIRIVGKVYASRGMAAALAFHDGVVPEFFGVRQGLPVLFHVSKSEGVLRVLGKPHRSFSGQSLYRPLSHATQPKCARRLNVALSASPMLHTICIFEVSSSTIFLPFV